MRVLFQRSISITCCNLKRPQNQYTFLQKENRLVLPSKDWQLRALQCPTDEGIFSELLLQMAFPLLSCVLTAEGVIFSFRAISAASRPCLRRISMMSWHREPR